MKRVNLCDTAYLELTDEQYNNSKTVQMKSDKNNETLWEAKEIYLPRNMVLLVPLGEFKEVETLKTVTKPSVVEPKLARQ